MKATSNQETARTIRDQACSAARFDNFAELTAVAVADRYLRLGRSDDARRILQRYLQSSNPPSAKVEQRLAALSA